MKRKLRLTALAVAAAAALALTNAALAAYTPRFAVSHNGGAKVGLHPTTLHVTIAQSDSPTAVIQFYVPTGYAVQTAAPGSTIGRATAAVFARDTGLTLPLEGPVTADDPAKHATDACSPGMNFAVWLLALSVAGQPVTIPVYVNPTPSAASALGAYVIRACLPPPDVPAATPGRALLGAQLLDVNFTVNNLTLPSGSDTTVWRTLFTPYTPGVGTPNLAGTVEARSFVRLPGAISLRAKYVRKTNTYRLSGSVTEAGRPSAGATVQIFRGRTASRLAKASSTKVQESGSYATAGHLKPKKTTYFQTRVRVAERDDAGGCAQTLAPFAATPPPCVGSTDGGFFAISTILRIKP